MKVRWAASVVVAILLTVMVGLFIWQRWTPLGEVGSPVTDEERRVAFAIEQLERICLSDLRASERTMASAELRTSLRNSDVQISSGKAVEIARGASQALPATLQVEERERIRRCLSDNLSAMMAALGKTISVSNIVDGQLKAQDSRTAEKGYRQVHPYQTTPSIDDSAQKIATLSSLLREGTQLADAPDADVGLNYQSWLQKASVTLTQNFDPSIAVGFERAEPKNFAMTGSTSYHRGKERAIIRSKNAFLERMIEEVKISRPKAVDL